MLALFYLGLAIAVGDLLCRRFYRFVSIAHRWAAAVLVGVLLSTWFTYLAVLAFSHMAEPLLSAKIWRTRKPAYKIPAIAIARTR